MCLQGFAEFPMCNKPGFIVPWDGSGIVEYRLRVIMTHLRDVLSHQPRHLVAPRHCVAGQAWTREDGLGQGWTMGGRGVLLYFSARSVLRVMSHSFMVF